MVSQLIGNPSCVRSQTLVVWHAISLLLVGMIGCYTAPPPQNSTTGSERANFGVDSSGRATSTNPSAVATSNPPLEIPRPPTKDDWFEDVTQKCGVNFAYRNGREGGQFTVIESMGGGVAMLDYDQDGDLDLFITGGGAIHGPPPQFEGVPSRFYRNDGDWNFVDVTSEAGLGAPTDYSIGCAVGDYNRDGFPDLLITCFGRTQLFRNTGRGGFVDATGESGLTVVGCHTSAAWADIDRDGWPDLYVCGYVKYDSSRETFCGDRVKKIREVCGPWTHIPAPHHLLRNCGDGSFEDVSKRAGITKEGKGLGVVALDLNEDGWIDFYVANDVMPNFLYLGGPDLQFEERGLVSGTAYDQNGNPQGSMGLDAGDFDGDGDADLFVTNYEMEDNAMYRNLGGAAFRFASAESGLATVCRPNVGFGTGFADFDLDGWLDLAVFNGHVLYQTGQSPYAQPSFLFRNLNGQRFENVSSVGGPYFGANHVCRGSAIGDLDNDGMMDAVIVSHTEPVTVLKNRLSAKNWFRVELQGTLCEPLAVGAVVSCTYAGRRLVRHVRGGGSYLSHGDLRVVFPFENDSPPAVTVRWLGGKTETFHTAKPRLTTKLIEGAGDPVSTVQVQNKIRGD